MKKLLLLPIAALAVASLAVSACVTVAPGPVVPKGSVVLGERNVAFKADRDVIPVGRYEGAFKSLWFVVEKNDIEVFNVVVTYGNGEKQKFDTRLVFNAGSRSRNIPMEAGKRRIRTISFSYKTIGKWEGGKARVVIYGVR